jgi:SAM-dependent methyltransferase
MKYNPENPDSLAREISEGGLVSASIAAIGATSHCKIRIRPVALKRGLVYQFERLDGAKAFHTNVAPENLASELTEIFAQGVTGGEITLESQTIRLVSNRRGEVSVLKKKTSSATSGANVDMKSHNREKSYIIEEGTRVPFLVDLGVMTDDGAVIERKRDKFRQINRFLEYIADIVPELEKTLAAGTASEITVVDFGCGKSYLTFATYYYLSAIRKLPVRIIGLDLKEDVIAECSRLAISYGYDKLSFAVGDIAEYSLCDAADLVISLHACDIATDYALERAVRWNAKVILSVPCCQHELNAQLASGSSTDAGATTGTGDAVGSGREILAPAFSHGIIRERMAALLTDAMRANLLERAGYRVQILEFIDMSHTPKNLLIRAVRRDGVASSKQDVASGKPAADYKRLRDFLGVAPILETLLQGDDKATDNG